jgi:hypothetical protein
VFIQALSERKKRGFEQSPERMRRKPRTPRSKPTKFKNTNMAALKVQFRGLRGAVISRGLKQRCREKKMAVSAWRCRDFAASLLETPRNHGTSKPTKLNLESRHVCVFQFNGRTWRGWKRTGPPCEGTVCQCQAHFCLAMLGARWGSWRVKKSHMASFLARFCRRGWGGGGERERESERERKREREVARRGKMVRYYM